MKLEIKVKVVIMVRIQKRKNTKKPQVHDTHIKTEFPRWQITIFANFCVM